jgi:hypothetical protein
MKITALLLGLPLAAAHAAPVYTASVPLAGKTYRLSLTFDAAGAASPETVGRINHIPFMDQPEYGRAPTRTISVCKASESFPLGTVHVRMTPPGAAASIDEGTSPVALDLESSDWSGGDDCALPTGPVGRTASLYSQGIQVSVKDPSGAADGYGLASIEVRVADPAGLPGTWIAPESDLKVRLDGFKPEALPSRFVALVSARRTTAAGDPYWGEPTQVAFSRAP